MRREAFDAERRMLIKLRGDRGPPVCDRACHT